MEVQVHYMMIKRSMRFLIFSYFILSIFPISAQILENDSIKYYECHSRGRIAYDDGKYDIAYHYFKRVIKDTDANGYFLGSSLYKIGVMYANGEFLKQNTDSALVYLYKAYSTPGYDDRGDVARFISHIFYLPKYNCIDKKKSFEWLNYAADRGSIKSNFELGELYEYGKSYICQDTTIIVGYSDNKRECYTNSRFIKSNIELHFPFIIINKKKAYEFYQYSFDVNYHLINPNITYYEIAKEYMDGIYLNKNLVESYEYMLNAKYYIAHFNYSISIIADIYWRLQGFYRFGIGTRVNLFKANKYLNMAAEYGHPLAKIAITYIQDK